MFYMLLVLLLLLTFDPFALFSTPSPSLFVFFSPRSSAPSFIDNEGDKSLLKLYFMSSWKREETKYMV